MSKKPLVWARTVLIALGLVGWVSACAADPDSGGGRAASNGGGQAGTAAAGTTGAGATAGGTAGTTDQFGNPIGPPPGGAGGTMAEVDAGGRCQPGVFCPPITPDGTGCGTVSFEPDVEVTTVPGNLLVVFDQSGSMEEAWGATTKIAAAQTALRSAVDGLQDQLTVGAIFFPTYACIPFFPPAPPGAVAPITDPSQITLRPGAEFLTAWDAKWAATGGAAAGIGTPLNEAMDRASVALDEVLPTLTGFTAVMVFTDGQPNCLPDPAVTMVPTALETAHAMSWLGNGVKTYVVGLPGATGAPILDQIAVAGGTTTYITPNDPAELQMRLNEIVQNAVSRGFNSCSITLTPAAVVVDELDMVVTEPMVGEQNVPHDVGMGGWTISPDGSQVELQGLLCDDAKAGRFESIRFEYGCVELPPLPPIMGPS